VTRVPLVAQADSSAHKTIAANVPLWNRFMIDRLSLVPWLRHPTTHRECIRARDARRERIEWTGIAAPTFRERNRGDQDR